MSSTEFKPVMSNIYDYPKLSSFVNSIVDRKVTALSLGISTSTDYFNNFINQARAQAQQATIASTSANTSATAAQTASTQTQIIWNQFNSSYAGILNSDPLKNALGSNFTVGAFYIRSTDKHFRVVTAIDNNGIPTWEDATLAVDPATVDLVASGKYLSLIATTPQTVQGPIAFGGTITVPNVTDWTSNSPPRASNVKSVTDSISEALSQEILRAQQAKEAAVFQTQQEITRAQNAEAELSQRINTVGTNLSAEVTNRTSAITAVNQAINNETTRATNVEASLLSAINNERDRAITAETLLQQFQNSFDSGTNIYGTWEKRRDIIEMYGFIPTTGTPYEGITSVNLPLILSSTNYNVQLTPVIAVGNIFTDFWGQTINNSKTTSSFSIQSQANRSGADLILGYDWVVRFRGTSSGENTGAGGTGGGSGGGSGGGTGGGGAGTGPGGGGISDNQIV